MAKNTRAQRGFRTIYSGESGYTQVLSITADGKLPVKEGQIITIFTPIGEHSRKLRQQYIKEMVLDAMEVEVSGDE